MLDLPLRNLKNAALALHVLAVNARSSLRILKSFGYFRPPLGRNMLGIGLAHADFSRAGQLGNKPFADRCAARHRRRREENPAIGRRQSRQTLAPNDVVARVLINQHLVDGLALIGPLRTYPRPYTSSCYGMSR